jgi:hypothetical protein
MSLKRSESSERARQTGSTALEGTSRNAPKAIKRLSTRQRPHVSDDDAFLDVHFRRELTGVLEVCRVGRFRPRSGSIYQSRNPCCARTPAAPPAQCAATVQAHDPPEHRLVPAYRIRYCYSMSSGDHTAEELFFLRVFLGLGTEAGAGWDVGRWPNGRAGVARDRGCAAGRSGRWASPIRSAIGW